MIDVRTMTFVELKYRAKSARERVTSNMLLGNTSEWESASQEYNQCMREVNRNTVALHALTNATPKPIKSEG